MTIPMDRGTWLTARKKGVGGSDIAAVLGLSPWATPYDVWLDKVGRADDLDPDSPPLYWGNVLEDVVAKEYAKRSGNKIQRVNKILQHPEHDFALANIDRAIINPEIAGNVRFKNGRLTTDRLLECKTSNAFMASLWGDPGSDQVPDYYVTQCQWYMGITQAVTTDLAVLIGGSDYRIYTIERDDGLIADMLDAAASFWELVSSGVAPDPQTVADCAKMWPSHIATKEVVVGVDVVNACIELAEIAEEKKALKALEDVAKLRILSNVQDAEAVLTHGGQRLATWKSQSTTRIDSKRLKDEMPEVAADYSKTTDSRVLRLSPAVKNGELL